jgi:hypothetical protein
MCGTAYFTLVYAPQKRVWKKEANKAHNQVRCLGERGNALLKGFKALRRVSLCPWRIGAIVSAALVLLHHRHARTT